MQERLKQEEKTWTEFLNRNFCQPTANGNRECDEGAYCDKCQAPWVDQEYQKYKETKKRIQDFKL